MAQATAAKTVEFTPDQRKIIVDELITNCNCNGLKMWQEGDREFLLNKENVDDTRLAHMETIRRNMVANDLVANVSRQGIDLGQGTAIVWNDDEGHFNPKLINKDGDTAEDDVHADPGEDVDYTGDHQAYDNDQDRGSEGATNLHKLGIQNMNNNQGSRPTQNAQRRTAPATQRAPTLNEYMRNAPPELREVLAEGMATRSQVRNQLIQQIVANERNMFPEEILDNKSTQELRAIAALAVNVEQNAYDIYGNDPTQNYNGNEQLQANYLGAAGPMTANRGNNGINQDDILPLPKTDWTTNDAAKVAPQYLNGRQQA